MLFIFTFVWLRTSQPNLATLDDEDDDGEDMDDDFTTTGSVWWLVVSGLPGGL